MDATALLERVAGPDRTTLTITPDPARWGELYHGLATALGPDGRLEITHLDLTGAEAAGERLVVRGRTRLLGLEVEAKLTVTFEGGAARSIVLLAKLPAPWRPADTYPALAKVTHAELFTSLVLGDAVVCLGSGAGTVTDAEFGLAGEELADGLTVAAAHLEWTDRLPETMATHAARHRAFKMARVAVQADAAQPCINVGLWWQAAEGGVLGSADAGFSLWAALTGDAPASTVSAVEAFENAAVGPGLALCDLGDDRSVWHMTFPEPRPMRGGLDALASLWGGDAHDDLLGTAGQANQPELRLTDVWLTPGSDVRAQVQLRLPDGGDYPWTGFDGRISLTSVDACATIPIGSGRGGTGAKPRLELTGVGTLFSSQWLVAVDTAEGVQAQLLPGAELKPAALLAELCEGLSLDLPDSSLTVTQARASLSTDLEHRSFLVAFGGAVELIPGQLVLDNAVLSLDVVDGKAVDRSLMAELRVGSLSFTAGAQWLAGAGWTLSAIVRPGEEATLANLVGWIADGLGAEVPTEVPDIALTDVTVTYNTASSDVAFTAAARWTPPADWPWAGKELDVELLVQSEKDQASGKRRAGFQITWVSEHGTEEAPRTFTVQAGYLGGAATVMASWESAGSGLGLPELYGSGSSLGDHPLPADGFWDGFVLDRAVLGFTTQPRTVEVAADVRLGGGHLVIDAALAGAQGRRLAAEWEAPPGSSVGLDDLLEALGISDALGLPTDFLPSGVNDFFSFDRVAVSYQEQPCSSFAAVAGLAKGSLDAFVVLAKPGGRWGAVAGVAVRDMATFKELLPGVVDDVLDALSLQPRFFALSSLPAVTPLPPGLGDGNHGEVHEGLTLAASFEPMASSNDVVKALCQVVALERLDVAANVSRSGFELRGAIPAAVKITVPGTGELTLRSPFLEIGTKGLAPQVALGGVVEVDLFGEHRSVELSLAAAVDGCSGVAVVQGVPFPSIAALPGIHIHDDYTVQVGVTYAPSGMRFGMLGQFHVGLDATKYHGNFGLVLNLDGGAVPDPLYLAFDVDTWDLWAHFELATGIASRLDQARQAAALAADATAGTEAGQALGDVEAAFGWLVRQYTNLQSLFSLISFKDVSVHWARQPVTLPDGTAVLPGVGFRGTLDLFGFKAFAALEFSSAPNFALAGHLEMDPIEVRGLVRIAGDGKGVTKAAATSGDWMTLPKGDGQKPDAVVVVKPGGPVVHVSAASAPFLHAKLAVSFFEFAGIEVDAQVDTEGFHFDILGKLGDLFTVHLGTSLKVSGGFRFAAEGSMELQLRGDIDLLVTTITIDSGFSARVKLLITDEEFLFDIGGVFRFQGNDVTLPSFTISVAMATLADLPGVIWGRVVELAEELFADVLKALERAWEAVEQAVLEAATAMVAAAEEAVAAVGHAADEAIAAIGQFGQNAALAIEGALGDAAASVVAIADEVFAGATVVGEAVAEALTEAADAIAHAAEEAAAAIEHAAEEVAQGVEDAYNTVASGVTDAAEAVGSAVEDAVGAVGDVASDLGSGISEFFGGLF